MFAPLYSRCNPCHTKNITYNVMERNGFNLTHSVLTSPPHHGSGTEDSLKKNISYTITSVNPRLAEICITVVISSG